MSTLLVVIVSNAKTDALQEMTQKAIDTAITGGTCVDVIVMECNTRVTYHRARTFYQQDDFNYNAFLNEGARKAKSTHIAFCNNDLVFYPGWADNIIAEMKRHKLRSASPLCPKYHTEQYNIKQKKQVQIGYKVGIYFSGWCFVWTRELFEEIGGLDETYKYYCSDNAVCDQLKSRNIKHGLVKNSVVNHLNNRTGVTLEQKERIDYTIEQVLKYNEKTGSNIFGLKRHKDGKD